MHDVRATRVAASCCAGLTRRRRSSRVPQVGSAAAAVAAYNSSWGYADLGMGPRRVRYTRDYSATLVGVAGAGDSRRPPSASLGCPGLCPYCVLMYKPSPPPCRPMQMGPEDFKERLVELAACEKAIAAAQVGGLRQRQRQTAWEASGRARGSLASPAPPFKCQ